MSNELITLNDYLYDGDTVLKILQRYTGDLRKHAIATHNPVDLAHSNFLIQMMELLEHNDFLSSQSHRIREFYKYMTTEYPHLAFTFKGRIKSLIRAEEKFNGYVASYIYDYYKENEAFPAVSELKERLSCFRDLIAYRIVISMPRCHLKDESERAEVERKLLYEIANRLPEFLEERGFNAEPAWNTATWGNRKKTSDIFGSPELAKESGPSLLSPAVQPYYRDYVAASQGNGYQSLHITFYDVYARSYIEVQLRTKEMDDYAEIGPANHLGYEKRQEQERSRRDEIPMGECIHFDEAYERCVRLQSLDLSKLDVNMFAAANNALINDGCGLFRGRQITPFEHLSRFQNELGD